MSDPILPPAFDTDDLRAFREGRKTEFREIVPGPDAPTSRERGDRIALGPGLPDLVVRDVRVERLGAITEAGAEAEGPAYELWDMALAVRDYGRDDAWLCMWGTLEGTPGYVREDRIWRASFRTLWERRHGPGSWEADPWVRVTAVAPLPVAA